MMARISVVPPAGLICLAVVITLLVGPGSWQSGWR
jgi:hypothetical protein